MSTELPGSECPFYRDATVNGVEVLSCARLGWSSRVEAEHADTKALKKIRRIMGQQCGRCIELHGLKFVNMDASGVTSTLSEPDLDDFQTRAEQLLSSAMTLTHHRDGTPYYFYENPSRRTLR